MYKPVWQLILVVGHSEDLALLKYCTFVISCEMYVGTNSLMQFWQTNIGFAFFRGYGYSKISVGTQCSDQVNLLTMTSVCQGFTFGSQRNPVLKMSNLISCIAWICVTLKSVSCSGCSVCRLYKISILMAVYWQTAWNTVNLADFFSWKV